MKSWRLTVPSLCGTLLITGFVAAHSTRAQDPGQPLTVTLLGSDPNRQVITFLVTNTSGKAITAYSYELRFRSREGQPLIAQPQVDGFRTAHLRPLLAPGQSGEDVHGLGAGVQPSDVIIGAVAVVFDDTTTAGAPALAEVILNRRAATREAKLFWLNTLKEHLVSHADSSAIRGLTRDQALQMRANELANRIGRAARMKAFTELTAFAGAQAHSREAGIRSLEAAILRDHLQQLNKATPVEVDQKTELVMTHLEQQYENVVKHSRRPR
jgi:hypothetical protein